MTARFKDKAKALANALFGRGWKHSEHVDLSFNSAYVVIGEVTQINYKVLGVRGEEYAHAFKRVKPRLFIRGDGKAAVLYPVKFTPRGFVP